MTTEEFDDYQDMRNPNGHPDRIKGDVARPCGLITGNGKGCPVDRYLKCNNDECGYQNPMRG